MSNSNNMPKRHMGLRTANTVSNVLIYILLVVICIVWLIPFIFILLQSFRVESTCQVGYVIPHTWGLKNYVNLLYSESSGLFGTPVVQQ